MGRVKEYYAEYLQIKEDTKLAEKLGITYDELSEIDWHIEADESRDGALYGYIVYFDDNSPKHILKKIKGLNSDNQVWFQPYELDDEEFYDYDEQYEAIVANKHYYDSFKVEIENIHRLNEVDLGDISLNKIFKRQLYAATIGTLETFLSETFINQTEENPEYFKKFIETFPDFKSQKFQLSEILAKYENLKKIARKSMLEVIYHNLDKVQNMYIATFNIKFPDIADLAKAVSTRHDLVHRNGKTKEGDEVIIDKKIIDDLIKLILYFVEEISNSLNLKGV